MHVISLKMHDKPLTNQISGGENGLDGKAIDGKPSYITPNTVSYRISKHGHALEASKQ